jgi:2-oxoglutarate ferredoxin oxidoreductase subunit delta
MKVFARVPIDSDEVHIPRGQVYLIPERCKGCNICVELCPKEVLLVSTQINTKGYHYPEIALGMEEACVQCDFCTVVCPEFAIYTVEIQT